MALSVSRSRTEAMPGCPSFVLPRMTRMTRKMAGGLGLVAGLATRWGHGGEADGR
jgi:hypothetical protein